MPWAAWPQVALVGGGMLLAVALWTGMTLQWNHHDDDASWTGDAMRVAMRLEEALTDSHRRAANVAGMLSLLQAADTRPPGRVGLEAWLRNALTGPVADFDGLQVVDATGRRLLTVGQPAEVPPETTLRGALLPGLLWHDDRLLLAGRMPAAEDGPGGTLYVATLRPGTLVDALRGERASVALRLADGTLVAVSGPTTPLLRQIAPVSGAPAPEAGDAAPRPAAGHLHHMEAPLPFGGASVLLETRDHDLLRRQVLISGAALAAAQLATTLLLLGWIGRRLRRFAADAGQARDGVQDGAPPGIGAMLGALPATLYRAEISAARQVSFTSLSETAAELTGLSGEEIARPGAWRDRVHPADLPALDRHLDALYRDGASGTEYRFRHGDGHTVWLREQARVVAVGPHGGADVMGYLADVSGERTARAQSMASAKLATLGRMATALAHEMTQPIGVMMLAAENALDAYESEGAAAAPVMAAKLGRILEQTRRAQSLVEHLRMFGHGDEGRTEAVDLASAVDGALLLCASMLERGGVAVEVAVPHRLPPVAANPVMLEQVILNLLVNAGDALGRVPRGQRGLTLRARALPDDRVELQVADTGRGLPPEAMARLFEPFFTTKSPGQGMGLGLPICHGIIRSFGGEITGGNAARGAVFTIRLPAAGPAADAIPARGSAGRTPEGHDHAR